MIKEQILQLENSRPKVYAALQVFMGSLFIATLAQVAIPLNPIPMSLQTLGVFLLPLFLEKRRAATALLLYLIEASLGLPVLAGMKANPFWLFGPTAGYLISFPAAAYSIGWLLERKRGPAFLWTGFSLLAGQAMIYGSGVSCLALMVGWKAAFLSGCLPFIFVDAYKIGLALVLLKGVMPNKKTNS